MSLRSGKLYYSISEVSEHFDVAPSLLRYWESEFSTIKPRRNTKGTRFYTAKDIEEIQKIYILVKENGFTLQGAKERLRSDKKKIDHQVEIVEKLENVQRFLKGLRDQI